MTPKVRHSRRKAIASVAALALLAGCIGAWRLLDRDRSVNNVHVTGPANAPTGPVLEWTEFHPDLGESAISGTLEPLGDGRILVSAFSEGNNGTAPGIQFLVTENGVDWSEVPMPQGISPLSHDLSGDRWLVAGIDLTGESRPVAGEIAGSGSRVPPVYRAFFSDDRGASWTELEFDFSSSSIQVPFTYEYPPFFISVALTSGKHMVIVLRGEEESASSGPDSGSGMSSGSENNTGGNPKSWIFASDGGALEQVADYDGWIYGGIIGWSFSTPAGFSLLYVEEGTEQAPAQPSRLTSPNGRKWSESESAGSFTSTALGPDGSLWRTTWLGAGYGLQQVDQEGALTTEVAFDNSIPFLVAAGPSGVAVNAVTVPGTDLFTLPDRRITKEGYELRLNEPEGGFTLWDLSASTAVYECGPEILWARGVIPAEDDCQFKYPESDDAEMSAAVLVFEEMQTGAELVSFTRGELLPAFPLWIITGLVVDSPEGEEQWLGWSADGADWGWQPAADAFGIDPSEANEAGAWLAVGDGFVLASMQMFDDSPPDFVSTRWFIAQVP